MKGIINTLIFIQENWSNLIILLAFILVSFKKFKDFMEMDKEERVQAALVIIKRELLKFMSDAELEWKDIQKSGALKKSQVIREIYTQFPILEEYVNQEELIGIISDMIDDGMEEMNKIINNELPTQIENKTE